MRFCKCGCGKKIKLRRSEGYLQRYERYHFQSHYSGSQHHNWKREIKMSKDYIRILDKDNPRINSKDPYSREHRVVMEKVLGRPFKG